MARRGFRTISLEMKKAGDVSVYTSPKIADALEKIMADMTLYEGIRLQQILEAVYLQGRKDGARSVIEAIDDSVDQVKKQIPHRAPGRPRKR